MLVKTTKTLLLSSLLALGLMAVPQHSWAQSNDVSPILLIESGPSDNPNYRRMVFVKYLSGTTVRTNYRAYNRTEFTKMQNVTPTELIASCATGPSTTLSEIKAFERAEAQRARRGEAPELVRFCIKNVRNWEGGNRKTYLDPIFEGLPQSAFSRS
jgi:hypothetical protein